MEFNENPVCSLVNYAIIECGCLIKFQYPGKNKYELMDIIDWILTGDIKEDIDIPLEDLNKLKVILTFPS